ncbi:MAG TPA: tetratricopeptide repeat protein, partial [bacterium]|nr:tetratricopeptide repeat protein [bacterium]
LDGAEQMHRKALEIDEKLGRLEGMANTYVNLGNVLMIRHDLDAAQQMYRKALELAERLDSPEMIAKMTSFLGTLREWRPETGNGV